MDRLKKQRAIAEKVRNVLKESAEAQGASVQSVFSYGTGYDSVFWIQVQSDHERDELKKNNDFIKSLFDKIKYSGYPEEVKEFLGIKISFKNLYIEIESQETVDREYAGNWRYRMT